MTATVDYEPGESTSGLFGGNSNWRGPVWFPVNYLFIESLLQLGRLDWARRSRSSTRPAPGDSSGCATSRDDLATRLVSIWLPDADGPAARLRRDRRSSQTDPEWRDLLQFHEYFHGDTGAGIGASHQTGWTGLVAHLLCRGGMLDLAKSGLRQDAFESPLEQPQPSVVTR